MQKWVFFPLLFSSFSTSSSLSLLKIVTSSSLEITDDFLLSSFLPLSMNPSQIAMNHICSSINQQQKRSTNNTNVLLQLDLEDHLLSHVSTDDISRILLRCQSKPLSALSFFNWAKTHLPNKLMPRNYCLIIHILTWSRFFSQARTFLYEMSEKYPKFDLFDCLVDSTSGDCNWSPTVFGIIVKVFVKMGKIDEGLRVLKKMVKMEFLPTTNECNCVMSGLIKANRSAECWDVRDLMKKSRIHSDTYTFNILTNVLCKCGNVGKAKEFMEEMEVEGFNPDIVTYNTLITGFTRKGKMDEAFYLYKIMHRRGVVPDSITYTLLITGLCQNGRTTEAHRLFHQMLHREVEPDGFMYNALIVGYCNQGKLMKGKLMLQEMIQAGFLPDRFTCYMMVESYMKAGELLPCLNMLAQLRKLGVSISFEIYTSLVVSLCREGRPNAARNLQNLLILKGDDGFNLNLEIYNNLINGYCSTDFIAEALELKDEMIAQGVEPNVDSYRFLITSLCRNERSADGESLIWEMVESFKLLPDFNILQSLLNGYCKKREYLKAETFLDNLAQKFQISETRNYNILINALCEEGNLTKSIELQNKMLKLGILPNAQTCKFLISAISRTHQS